MKQLVLLIPIILIGMLFADSEINSGPHQGPQNLPVQLRYRNWVPRGGPAWNGSCVVAATCDNLTWQGKPEVARRLRQRYGGGQDPDGWNKVLNAEGIRYAYTFKRKNVEFLETACRTRRGACVALDSQHHMVYLVDMTTTQVCIMGVNFPEKLTWMDREKFLDDWFSSNSWAFTPVYTPTSPRPQ